MGRLSLYSGAPLELWFAPQVDSLAILNQFSEVSSPRLRPSTSRPPMPLSDSLSLYGSREQILRIGPWKLRLSFWPLQLGGWLLYLLVPAGLWLSNRFENREVLWLAMVRPFFGILTTTAIRPLCRRFSARRCNPLYFILWTSLAALSVAAVDFALTLWLGVATGNLLDGARDPMFSAGLLLMRWISVAIWILLYFTLKQSQRSAALDLTNREAELMLLRSQIEPHFLFNALNSILAEARDPEKVRLLTHSLAEYLRFSLQHQGALPPLCAELGALEHYLRVQKIRFEEGLEYVFEVSPEASAFQVPPGLIQPLLENALKFGQRTSPIPLRLWITAAVDDAGRLLMSVENTGTWVDPDAARSLSTGIQNLRRRLALIYGAEANFSLGSNGERVFAKVSVPAGNQK